MLQVLLFAFQVLAQEGKCYAKNRPTVAPPPPPEKEPDVAPENIEDALGAHNFYRSKEGIPPVAWDNSIASIAQNYANQLAATKSFEHSGQSGLGENLAMGTADCKGAVDMWYQEKSNFIRKSGVTGHFTQVIWKGTTKIGCGYSGSICVCNYSPAGNYVGRSPYQ